MEFVVELQHKKVFAVYGPYPMVRHTLRKRGWVEHEYNIPKGRAALKKKKKKKVKEAFSPSKPTVGDQKAKKQDGSDGSTDADKDDDDDDDDDDDGDIDDGDDSTPKFEGYEPMTVAEKEEWGMLVSIMFLITPTGWFRGVGTFFLSSLSLVILDVLKYFTS